MIQNDSVFFKWNSPRHFSNLVIAQALALNSLKNGALTDRHSAAPTGRTDESGQRTTLNRS
jgi:hypothetical protein